MVELLNTRLMCVATAMAALTTGCAVGAGEADIDESDADEAVTVEETSQALCGNGDWRSCGAPGGFTSPTWGGNLPWGNQGWGVPGCGNGGFTGGNPWGNQGWNNWGNFGNFRPCGGNPWGGWRPPCGGSGVGGFAPGWGGGGGCGRF